MNKLFLTLLFVIPTAPLKAKDIYVAQDQTGNGAGVSCDNARNAAWFNRKASWGSEPAQIGPSTTVHLCGRFTGSPGQQMLTVHGSGGSGKPIVLLFENGTVFSAPYWSSQGAIWMDGASDVVVDGGSSGVIENSDNGTERAYHNTSVAIHAAGCKNCTVQHVIMSNLYVRTLQSDIGPNHSQINCVFLNNSDNFKISHTTCHDAGWAYAGFGNNFTLEYSNIYNVDHGLAFGPSGTSSGFSIHDNHFYNYVNWDSAENRYHHDGIHMWGQRGGRVTNGVIYNNRFDGDSGVNITAHIYLQDSIENVTVYNNIFLVPSNRTMNALWFAAGTNILPGGPATGNSALNNYINAGGHRQGSALFIQGQYNFTAVNNVVIGGVSNISVAFGGSFSSTGIDHNIYLDLDAEAGDHNAFGYQGKMYNNLAAWRSVCRCDARSKLLGPGQIKANSFGQLLSGSAGIGAGANLMHLANGVLSSLARDVIQTSRPASNSWDIGAYQTVNGAPLPLPPNRLPPAAN
jgi:hypothetical protein